MSSMAEAIIPKSDQLNADDLIAGPMTITITDVSIKGGQEQPVSIHFEGDNGKPYKSCKSMNRVLVTAWGPDAKKYIGRSLTLYRDATVKWGGMEVGGIRISHMSDIDSAITMALTVTRANKKPFTVRPLTSVSPAVPTNQPTGESKATGEAGVSAPARPKLTPAEKTAQIVARFAELNMDAEQVKTLLGKDIHLATKDELRAAWDRASAVAEFANEMGETEQGARK